MKLKKLKKNIGLILGAGMLLSLLPHSVQAEATKVITDDFGVYSGAVEGSEPFSITTFSFGGLEVNLDHVSASPPPEGKKSAITTIYNQWGGWGIINTTGFGNFIIQNRNYSDYQNGHLRVWAKCTEGLTFEIQYGPGFNKSFAIASTGNNWQEFVIPLQTGGFGLSNGQLADIRVPFLVRRTASNPGATTWEVDHVRWTKPLDHLAVFPSSHTLTSGQKRQITVEGRSAANEHILLYSTYATPASVGTVTPSTTPSQSTELTGNTSDGNVTATAGAFNIVSTIDNVPSVPDRQFGVFSETISTGVLLDVNGALGVFSGNGGADPVAEDDTVDFVEGIKSLKTTVDQTEGYTGWFIQWGSTNTAQSYTVNLKDYYEGTLRFWFKGPAALSGKVLIKVRSGNVEVGQELSEVLLDNYVTFDNTWHPVAIPMSAFAKTPPWADISRMKLLFTLVVTGNTSGAKSVWFDNIRYDSRTPGPLNSIQVNPSPADLFVGTSRRFTAQGFDSNGTPVDILPNWDMPGTSLGSLSPTSGAFTVLTAANTPVAQNPLRATVGAFESSALVTVVDFDAVQSLNVYSDNGFGGDVGAATGGAEGTDIALSELTGTPPEGTKFFRAIYSLVNPDAFVVWFVEQQNGVRFMGSYNVGWLHFWVKTNQDLEVSIRSDNIDAGTNLAKVRLSELGIPLDNQWRRVIVPLTTFSDKQPGFDYDQIKTFFAIGAVGGQIGNVTNQTFDVDDVKWMTSSADLPSLDKVYKGLTDKQRPSGLVRSFEGLPQAVTYDNALAAIAYTYKKDYVRTQNIFNVYNAKTPGFHDEYNVDNPAIVIDNDRLVGPNAWMLLAIMHYRNTTGNTTYDAMMNNLAAWILSFQAPDGAIKFGTPINPAETNIKSTEHNFDAYAAFLAYYDITGNLTYKTAAENIRNWLDTEAYDSGQGRFNVGENPNGTFNTDKALDVYAWAPLALSSYTAVLSLADTDFRNSQINDLTGILVDGFDFGGPFGQPPDKDAVWLEGTAHMALAYSQYGSSTTAVYFRQELDKAVFSMSPTSQGLTYATNNGTAYGGFLMDSLNPAVSSMAWYLFAHYKFNPFRPTKGISIEVLNIADNQPAPQINWSVTVPARWVRADQYVKISAQPNTIDDYAVQIYTDNSNPLAVPNFVDPTPEDTQNVDSDPAGLLLNNGPATTSRRLFMAWSAKNILDAPPAFNPADCPGVADACQWLFMRDRSTPAIDFDGDGNPDSVAFTDGEEDSMLMRHTFVPGNPHDQEFHGAQGDNFFKSEGAYNIYFSGDFTTAGAQVPYLTTITFELFLQ